MNANNQQELRVDLVFSGEVLPGFEPEQVKRAIANFFKLDDARRDRMFSGAPYVVKRGATPTDASRYIALFAKMGGRLHLQDGPAPEPAPTGARAPEPAAGPLAGHPAARAPAPSPSPTPSLSLSPLPSPAAAKPPSLALVAVEDTADRPSPSPSPSKAAPDAWSPARPAAMRDEPMVVVAEPPSVFGVGLSGRLARRPYGAGALFGWAAMRWALLGLAHHPHAGVGLLIGLGLMGAALWTFRLSILRLHDIGLSGWWVLVGIGAIVGTLAGMDKFAIVGALAGLFLAVVPGSVSDNRFGAVPDPGSRMLRLVVSVAVMCIGAVFRQTALFGDGAGLMGQDVQQADAPHQAPTDEELAAALKTVRARREFREAYWPAASHKAFASSDGGAWGWSGDAGTADSAREQSLAQCEKLRDAYSAECRVVNVDGDWAE